MTFVLITAVVLLTGALAWSAYRLQQFASALALAAWHADHDLLTGLANRDLLQRTINGWLGAQQSVVLGLFSLDGLRTVNSVHGHATGDHLLRVAARRLREAAGPGALVARLRSDEFVIAWPNLATSDPHAHVVAVHHQVTAGMVYIGHADVPVRVSVGVATSSYHGNTNLSGLLRHADQACAHAKQAGNTVVAWHPDLPTTEGYQMGGRPAHRLRDRAERTAR